VDLDVPALAASLRLSPSRLRHLFRAETGLPIGRYILKRRLEVAAHLLRTSYLSVKEVSEAARFKNTSHFVREFHKSFGTPPREYRRSHASQRIAISDAK
jgi:transcriptional regulator GlxA family with amidase domain